MENEDRLTAALKKALGSAEVLSERKIKDKKDRGEKGGYDLQAYGLGPNNSKRNDLFRNKEISILYYQLFGRSYLHNHQYAHGVYPLVVASEGEEVEQALQRWHAENSTDSSLVTRMRYLIGPYASENYHYPEQEGGFPFDLSHTLITEPPSAWVLVSHIKHQHLGRQVHIILSIGYRDEETSELKALTGIAVLPDDKEIIAINKYGRQGRLIPNDQIAMSEDLASDLIDFGLLTPEGRKPIDDAVETALRIWNLQQYRR